MHSPIIKTSYIYCGKYFQTFAATFQARKWKFMHTDVDTGPLTVLRLGSTDLPGE